MLQTPTRIERDLGLAGKQVTNEKDLSRDTYIHISCFVSTRSREEEYKINQQMVACSKEIDRWIHPRLMPVSSESETAGTTSLKLWTNGNEAVSDSLEES